MSRERRRALLVCEKCQRWHRLAKYLDIKNGADWQNIPSMPLFDNPPRHVDNMGCCFTVIINDDIILGWINDPTVSLPVRESLNADFRARKERGENHEQIAQAISRAIWRDQVYTRIASSGLQEGDQQAVRQVFDGLAKSPQHPLHVEKAVGKEILARLRNN